VVEHGEDRDPDGGLEPQARTPVETGRAGGEQRAGVRNESHLGGEDLRSAEAEPQHAADQAGREEGGVHVSAGLDARVAGAVLAASCCATAAISSFRLTPRLTTQAPFSSLPRVAQHSAQRSNATSVVRKTDAASRASSTGAKSGFRLSDSRTRSSRMGPMRKGPSRATSAASWSSISSRMSLASIAAPLGARYFSVAAPGASGRLRDWMSEPSGTS